MTPKLTPKSRPLPPTVPCSVPAGAMKPHDSACYQDSHGAGSGVFWRPYTSVLVRGRTQTSVAGAREWHVRCAGLIQLFGVGLGDGTSAARALVVEPHRRIGDTALNRQPVRADVLHHHWNSDSGPNALNCDRVAHTQDILLRPQPGFEPSVKRLHSGRALVE